MVPLRAPPPRGPWRGWRRSGTACLEYACWPSSRTARRPVAGQEANVRAQARQDVPGRPRARQKAEKGNKRATAHPGAKKAATGRQGSKTAKILALPERPQGASLKLKELMAATGWQAHSVRGFISGQVRKKMGRIGIASDGRPGECGSRPR